jgi:hypothetical protein
MYDYVKVLSSQNILNIISKLSFQLLEYFFCQQMFISFSRKITKNNFLISVFFNSVFLSYNSKIHQHFRKKMYFIFVVKYIVYLI